MSRAQNVTTSDYTHAFDAETGALLRKRFLLFVGILIAWALLTLALQVKEAFDLQWALSTKSTLNMIFDGSAFLFFTGSFVYALRSFPDRGRLVTVSIWVVLVGGTLIVAQRAVGLTMAGWQTAGIMSILVLHVLACSILPWSPQQALKPAIPVLILAIVNAAMTRNTALGATLTGSMYCFTILPGTFICWMRHSRRTEQFKLRFLQSRYGEIRRELTDARRIHESLFPTPHLDGPIRFNYFYEPMRQIGGDYLHAHWVPSEDGREQTLNLALLDVTGHGVAAALTVNRLHGELERLYAEDPFIAPGDVLRLLNRYVHLTLSTHSVYATAFILRVDPTEGVIRYANGGHPPAFLRGVGGTLEQLASTSFLLGACADRDFDPGEASVQFGPGDTLLAYTDGAIECANAHGKMLGIRGIQRVLASVNGDDCDWIDSIFHAVTTHRSGPPADDTLIIEVTRSLRPAEARTPEVARAGDS